MHALVEILDDCERVLSSPEQIEALATALQRRHNELELARGPYDLLQQVRQCGPRIIHVEISMFACMCCSIVKLIRRSGALKL